MGIVQSDKLSSLLAILSYCGSSILMTLVNKYVLAEFHKPPVVFLMLSIQALSCILLVHIFGYFRLLNFRAFNQEDAKKWFPVSLIMSLMLYTGSKSLEHLQVGIFTVFKNLTIILVAYGEKAIFNAQVTPLMLFSFFIMVMSSILGAQTSEVELSWGFAWMTANCISSALFVLYMRKAIKSVSFKDFDTVYFNNLLTFPLFLLMSVILENWSGLYAHYTDPVNSELLYPLLKGLIISGISAFAISYTSAWCIRVTNSTTYSMVGALNKLPVALFGMFWFQESRTIYSLGAVFLGFLAGVIYSRAKTLQQKQQMTTVNPASNDYNKIEGTDQDEDENGLPIVMDDLEKKNRL